jgi:hypothetical protein
MKTLVPFLLLLALCSVAYPLESANAKVLTNEELTAQLKTKMFPLVEFKAASVGECITWLKKNGIPVVATAECERKTAETKLTLTLRNVPAREVLLYITNLSATKFEIAGGKVHLKALHEVEK